MSWEIKQRVNFYLDEFQPPKIPDDLKMILIGAGLDSFLDSYHLILLQL